MYGVNVSMHSFWDQETKCVLRSKVNEEFYVKAFEKDYNYILCGIWVATMREFALTVLNKLCAVFFQITVMNNLNDVKMTLCFVLD